MEDYEAGTQYAQEKYYYERDKELADLRAQVEQAREALEGIAGYWNRDRNDEAMHDACWHAIETAEAALQALREGADHA